MARKETHTRQRSMRIADELWADASSAARGHGQTVSSAIRGFLVDLVEGNLPGYTAGFAAGVAAARESDKRIDSM